MPRKSQRRGGPSKARVPHHGIVGDCPEVRSLLREVRRYARTALPALIIGETGTGKELIARHLHRASPRRSEPLVTVVCPNLPEQLVESELFGHKRGAFTGAVEHRVGAFEEADGGTLFFDEIGDMPLPVQAKILRVLQEGVISRLGETRERRVDVRVVAATWCDLPEMVADGTFREDLYNRLAYCVVRVPPLRDRGHDVVLLARALMVRGRKTHGLPRRALSREVEAMLGRYPWPGNVRELEGALYRATMMGSGRSLGAEDLRNALGHPDSLVDGDGAAARELTIEAVLEHRAVMTAGELRAALGVSKSTLARRVQPLVAGGRVVRLGRGAATRYRLPTNVLDGMPIDRRWAVALFVARRDGRITRGGLASALCVSERTATRVLGAMVDAGLMSKDGKRGRGVRYYPTT